MVALRNRKPQPRHWECGPIHQDIPLKVFNENAADLAENQQRLSAAKSWWPERLLLVLAGVVFVIWMWGL